jgi:hypothetical protein
MMESSSGQMLRIVQELSKSDPSRLAQYRQEYESLVAEYLKDNQVHQQFLMTRAIKK